MIYLFFLNIPKLLFVFLHSAVIAVTLITSRGQRWSLRRGFRSLTTQTSLCTLCLLLCNKNRQGNVLTSNTTPDPIPLLLR